MDKHLLEGHILKLEKSLLQPEVRQSAEQISNYYQMILLNSVVQVGYMNIKGAILLIVERKQIFQTGNIIASDVILAKYKIIKHSKSDKNVYSLRSSRWKCIKGKWKMIFHQGTLTDEF